MKLCPNLIVLWPGLEAVQPAVVMPVLWGHILALMVHYQVRLPWQRRPTERHPIREAKDVVHCEVAGAATLPSALHSETVHVVSPVHQAGRSHALGA